MNGHFNLCHGCDFLKLHIEFSSLTWIFHEKAASTGSRVSFLKSWFHKNHKNRGATLKKNVKISNSLITRLLEGPTYAKLRLPPHIRSFSTCSFRQTATLTGSKDRIDPIYFLYRDVNFFAEKIVFSWFPRCVPLLRAARDRFEDKK